MAMESEYTIRHYQPHRWFALRSRIEGSDEVEFYEVALSGNVIRVIMISRGQFRVASSAVEYEAAIQNDSVIGYSSKYGGVPDQPVTEWDFFDEFPVRPEVFEAIWIQARIAREV